MKKILSIIALSACTIFGYAQERTCNTVSHMHDLQQTHPRSNAFMQKIEQHTQEYLKKSNTAQARANEQIITIPVVVHVVYGTSAQNISNAQIMSQLQVLNEDFRRTNPDAGNTPTAFAGVASDVKIEFCLATVDPSGNPTSGITRRSTSVSSFSDNDNVKYNSAGGTNAWPAADYMNMWVCNLSPGLLGYAQFPGSGAAATDGVVMSYKYFGRNGSAQAPFNKGRTATHEVGHYLNLRHIWGDGGCSYDDGVSDTPLAGYSHSGCPSWPTSSCSSNDMYMNYMDYVDDACMNLFTNGQKDRMRALFSSGGYRESLLSSTACGGGNPPTASYCATNGQDASYEWIAGVQVGSLNNTSGNDGGYKDNTSISTTLNTGSNYNVTLTPGFSGETYNEYWKIWIDYNQDKDFDDAGELVYDAGSMSTAAVSGSFTVPSSATTGSTRMRVSMKYNGAQTACETFNYGEVEDYTVNITSVTPCNAPGGLSTTSITSNSATVNFSSVSGAENYTLQYKQSSSSTWTNASSTNLTGLNPNTAYNWRIRTNCTSGTSSAYSATQSFTTLSEPCNTPTGVSSSSVAQTTATVSWNAVSGAASYTFGYRVSGASTWTNATVSGTSRNLTGLTASTSYQYRVRTNCSSNNSAYSTVGSFTTLDEVTTPAGYCESKGSNSSYEWIANVTVGGLNNSTGNNGGYADFTSSVTTLEKESAYSVSLSPGFSGSTYNEYWKIWIDYNQDGDFADAGELAYDAGSMSTSTVTGNLTVPSTALTGETRMRVSMKYNAAQTVCETFQYGEVEDYTVNIIDAAAPPVTYCASKGNSVADEWIARVAVAGIDNSTGANGGYADFTSISGNVNAGTGYSVTLTPGYAGSVYNEYWKIWIDFNRDGDFNDAGEEVFTSGGLSSTTVTGTLNVPSNVSSGTTRMRVAMKYNGAPTSCEAFSYGEVEDYTVNVNGSGARVTDITLDENLSNVTDFNLKLFPNPASDRMTMDITAEQNSNVNISIFDMQGRIVYNSEERLEGSNLTKTISVSDLANGTYHVVIKNNELARNQRLIIAK